MYPLIFRSREEAVRKHTGIPVRVYETDSAQAERIRRSRECVLKALSELGGESRSIVELGCGTADISGPFAEQHRVMGFECSIRAAGAAKLRFPKIRLRVGPLELVEPQETDLLVLCEILEHVADPVALVQQWLPVSKYSLISHPLNEAVESTMSGGEHQWGFTEEDVENWFVLGGHKRILADQVAVGGYTCTLSMGRRAT